MATHSYNKAPKGVSFGSARVREHERILLDGTENDIYAYLALGWAHRSSRRVSLNDTDDYSSSLAGSIDQPRECSTSDRIKVLNDYGFTTKDILRTEMRKKQQTRYVCRRVRRRASHASSSSSTQRRSTMKRFLTLCGLTKK